MKNEVCLICGRKLHPVFRDGPPSWPALEFETVGNFGSTILDCFGPKIKFQICDVCIVERLDRIKQEEYGGEPLGEIREDVQKWYEATPPEELI